MANKKDHQEHELRRERVLLTHEELMRSLEVKKQETIGREAYASLAGATKNNIQSIADHMLNKRRKLEIDILMDNRRKVVTNEILASC